MDVRMSSLPSGGPMRGCGSNGYFVDGNAKYTARPQVTLNLNVHPPVLDTAGSRPASSKSSNLCGGTRRFGGQWLAQFRNVCNSYLKCSGTPVTWVNPAMVQQFPPQAVQQLYPEARYPMLETSHSSNQNPPLWYPATPGSHVDYLDPLHAFSYPSYNMGSPAYPGEVIPGPKNGFHKSSQPLNPEAKEWIPNNFKNNKESVSSVPKCSLFSSDKNVQNPVVITSLGFIEITDKEINEVRKNMENEKPKNMWDDESNTSKMSNNVNQNTELIDKPVNDEPSKDVVDCSKENDNCCTSSLTSVVDSPDSSLKECNRKFTDIEQSKNALSHSYACITRKSPEPSPLNSSFEDNLDAPSPSESFKQPLPKIFIKDKKYPKEKAAPFMENQIKDPLPFRTATKTQKSSRKKFLKDLRDLSPAKSDCSFSGSEGSLDSSSEFISRLCMGSSTSSVGSPSSILPREKINPVSNITSKNAKSQRSVSESSGSSGQNRTNSESSTCSADSVDIEFNDDCDIIDDKLENVCFVTDTCKSKHPNSILAHILGLDSESEDSDDESDSDWDNVDECDSVVLDDSWETFGLAIPLVAMSPPSCSKSVSVGEDDICHSENICDNDYVNYDLDDVNKCWEREVMKDVADATPTRVQFGEASVRPMVTWSYAYKNARRGPWEQYARDRARFNNRISALEPVIAPVLGSPHREAMYCKIYGC